MNKSNDHPLRARLNDEIHGRAGHPIEPPAEILHLAFTLARGDADPVVEIESLSRATGQPVPATGKLHHAIKMHDGLLRFERHGEFYRISLSCGGKAKQRAPENLVPAMWLDNLPGERLVAIHTTVRVRKGRRSTSEQIIDEFGHSDVASSSIGQGEATVWTDFRIGEDSYTRFIVESHGMSPIRLGRALRRLHEIETYRMMALLTLPVAQELQPRLTMIESELNSISSAMQDAEHSDDDARLLHQLTKIAKTVEDMNSQSAYRFSAARAYSALVRRRIEELNEERVPNHQRLGTFLDRRFSPAMATCQAVEGRLSNLAARCERTSNLLRTRVDISVEKQNQELLSSMNQRAHQQLRLQQTVEGLSVVAISYYAWSLLSKLADSLGKSWQHYDSRAANIVLIPLVVFLSWYLIRRARKHVA